jgi:hypothetical protein
VKHPTLNVIGKGMPLTVTDYLYGSFLSSIFFQFCKSSTYKGKGKGEVKDEGKGKGCPCA